MPETTTEARGIMCELIDPATGNYVFGSGAIIPGADIAPEVVEAAVKHYTGDDHDRIISEVQHLRYVPRIMWCERLDGFGCDQNGEWHSHWEGVKHNPVSDSCCYTLALPVYDRSEATR